MTERVNAVVSIVACLSECCVLRWQLYVNEGQTNFTSKMTWSDCIMELDIKLIEKFKKGPIVCAFHFCKLNSKWLLHSSGKKSESFHSCISVVIWVWCDQYQQLLLLTWNHPSWERSTKQNILSWSVSI